MTAEEEGMLKYSTTYGGREGGTGMWLLGCVDRGQVPRHHYLKVRALIKHAHTYLLCAFCLPTISAITHTA